MMAFNHAGLAEKEYAYRHLAWHLYQAGKLSKLLQTVQEWRWFKKKVNFDPSRKNYADDVELAIQAAQDLGREGLGDFVVYSLIFGLLGSVTMNLDPAALALMATLGHSNQAESYISLYVDPVRQMEAYALIAIEYAKRGKISDAHNLVERATSQLKRLPIGQSTGSGNPSATRCIYPSEQNYPGRSIIIRYKRYRTS